MKWYWIALTVFLSTIATDIVITLSVWFIWIKPIINWVVLWWNRPLDTPMPPFPFPFLLTTATIDKTYAIFWIIVAIAFAIEGVFGLVYLKRISDKGK